MLSVSEARERILSVFKPVDPLTVSLKRAAGRILAGDIAAEADLPLFDNSAVDGFVLHKADLVSPSTLKVIADIAAGDSPEIILQPGQSARIMTGALLPPGAGGIAMVEDTDFKIRAPGTPVPKTVTILKSIQPGENIRHRGEDLHRGDKVLLSGTCLRAQDIGLLALLGVAKLRVYRQPRLALLSCGDELLPVEIPLTSGKIHESNSYTLAAQAESTGANITHLGVAADNEVDIRSRLEQAVAAKADLIVSSAGVSVGAFDYVKNVIEKDGELDFWKVNMRPGKPLAFGKYHGIPFFGLPGNPVSAFIGFELFVKPALEKLSGQKVKFHPSIKARLTESIESDGRESFLRAKVTQEKDRLIASLTGPQGSGNIFSLVRANALLIVPSGVKSLPANSEVEIWPIE